MLLLLSSVRQAYIGCISSLRLASQMQVVNLVTRAQMLSTERSNSVHCTACFGCATLHPCLSRTPSPSTCREIRSRAQHNGKNKPYHRRQTNAQTIK